MSKKVEKILSNEFVKQRIQKIESMKELGLNPYKAYIKKEISVDKFIKKFEYLETEEERELKDEIHSVVGRVRFIRLMGKAAFMHIEDEGKQLQLYMSQDTLGEDKFKTIVKKIIDVGDIIIAKGHPFVTRTNELTISVDDISINTKSIIPLPEKFHGLQDKELRYRQRYLDLIMNPEVKKVFITRSKVISIIRDFFDSRGFLEVETPMLNTISGGANAKPFITHYNALGIDQYLRIATELYLKKLVVGGMDAVYEIGKIFRNEGMDATHNPEFTSIEFYWAYKSYLQLMDVTEELITTIIEKLNMDKIIEFGEYKINLKTPFTRITYKEALNKIGGIPNDVLDNKENILIYLKDHKIDVNDKLSIGYLLSELFDNFVEDKLIDPTFITDYPIDISPLSRKSDDNEQIAERFELFIAGREIANAFNELSDPQDQYNRFKKQLEAKENGDSEAHEMDEDFINALCYGLPPTAGEGIGIDRLVMLLTNSHSIRDVLLFPAMKPLGGDTNE